MTFLELKDSTRIRFCKRGSGKKVFVLVHGWKQSHRLFDSLVNLLAHDNTVFTYDQRGMGESDKPDVTYDFELLSDDLGQLLDHFNFSDVTLLGWSMGCTTILSYVRKGNSRIGRIALMNGPIRLTTTEDFEYALSEEALNKYILDLENDWPKNEKSWFSNSVLEKNSYLVDLLFSVGLQTPLDVALKLVREQAKVDHRQTILDLELPILAIYSKHDPYWPTTLADWIVKNSRFGDSQYLENSAHCAPLEESLHLSKILIDFSAVGESNEF